MPDRYWVGGTANWDGTAGTKWATTSGGAGGASVPTSADDVYFDAASGAVTCTVSSNFQPCRSLNFTGFTGTISSTAFGVNIFGSLVLSSTMTITGSAFSWQMAATTLGNTLTSNGKTLTGNLNFSGVGGSFLLSDALVCSGTVTVTAGTFTTNNFNVSATQLSSSNNNTRTINLGSSTVTLTLSGGIPWQTGSTINLTFNAGTSTIIFTGTSPTFDISSGTLTFNNVSFTNTTVGTVVFPQSSGGTVFNNITVTAPASAGVTQVRFPARQTINGTLSTSSTAGNRRVWFQGSTYGIAQTLTINSAPSLTDADFRDLYVIGTAAPISGTRIGNLRGCRGITFSTPKTVYWNLAGTNNWNANAWATTPTGTPSTDNFPLAQDTATFTNAGAITQVSAFNFTGDYVGTVDMSGRTSAMTIQISNTGTVYGNWINGSGTTITNAVDITFSGRNTQTITSAGKTFSGGITVDSYGGTVQLADALNIGSNTLTITNGTFSTQNYNVTAGSLFSNNSNVRTINLGSSTVTLSNSGAGFNAPTTTNLTFNAGTSQINISGSSGSISSGGLVFYNVSFTGNFGAGSSDLITGANTFNNFSINAPNSALPRGVSFAANQIINGTLTVAGATAVRRIFLRSDTLGTTRTLTVNSLSAQDCDFRDITIAGAAAGTAPTRAGDCGGNTGITFPAPKTVYWNLAGSVNWSATGWATSSGGTPAVDNFPLAQDTAVFDNAGALDGVTTNASWNIGSINMSGRTLTGVVGWSDGNTFIYGDVSLGSGIAVGGTGTSTLAKRGTQTITSSGNIWQGNLTVDCITGTVLLADALTLSGNRTLSLTTGTFNAVAYNVTTGRVVENGGTKTLRMGSGTWTLAGIGVVWDMLASGLTFFKGTANIVLSDTTTTARTFSGAGLSYNRLTIGGATGISITTITGNNQFTELASTKTVAHTIALGTTAQTFGAWTVTGTAGNVVTVTGTGAGHVIAGARVSGVNYLAMGTIGFAATSPGEFYAGPNSTGTGTGVILTAAPAPVTRFWRGGTGTWDATTTTNWSATSGGAGGASVPTSADAVVFNSASNATAYTVTCTATQLRCASLTMAGPGTGNVTWAGTAPLAIHGNVSLAATGITRTYTGAITLSGSATGRTFTTNGVTLASAITVNGVGCEWRLGSSATTGNDLTVTNGQFNTDNYNFTPVRLLSSNSNSRLIRLGTSTVSLGVGGTGTMVDFTTGVNLSFFADTSSITIANTSPTFNGGGFTFYNVAFTSTNVGTITITGQNRYNNLTVAGLTSAGVKEVTLSDEQIINDTLTLSAGTNAAMRTFVRSNTLGTPRRIDAVTFAAGSADIDFRDITVIGAAAPISGTRFGDGKGNSGITFDAPKTVWWGVASSGLDWANQSGNGSWSLTNGGATTFAAFPLAQDTVVFPSSPTPYPSSGGIVTLTHAYNIGTIDMSARTSNTIILAVGSNPFILGNWVNGTGTTMNSTGTLFFGGRGSQTITSAGAQFTQTVSVNSPGGTVTLQDAFLSNRNNVGALTVVTGTFNANNYNVTLTASGGGFTSSSTSVRTVNVGSGTWTLPGVSTWNISNTANLTLTGTGTIRLTNASSKTFAGGGISYSGITLDQGGVGTLTITGNNTFANITNSYKTTGATTIAMGTTTQRVGNFTASGEAGRVLTVQGTSASSPATLIYTGTGQAAQPAIDYLTITGVRAYSLDTTWYAGDNSTNNGSLGWYFAAGGGGPIFVFVVENASATTTETVVASVFNASASENAAATDAVAAGAVFLGTLVETATAADVLGIIELYLRDIAEAATSSDLVSATVVFASAIAELTNATDLAEALKTSQASVSETTQATETAAAAKIFQSAVSETTVATEIAAALKLFNAAILEATTAVEVQAAQAAFLAAVPEQVSGADVAAALATVGSSVTELAAATDASRRARRYLVNAEDYVATEAVPTALTVEATATSNTASGTVESGQITATVLP